MSKSQFQHDVQDYMLLEGYRLEDISETIMLIQEERVCHTWGAKDFSYEELAMAINADICTGSLLYT